MKITGYGAIGSGNGIKKRGDAAQAGSFSDILAAAEAGDASPASEAAEVAAASPLGNLLALQEVSEEDVRRRKLVQHGKSLLDTLEDLRRQLLMGTLPPHVIRNLSQQLSVQKQSVTDTKLAELMDDIELRAAVELAKLEQSMIRSSDHPIIR